MVEQEKVLLIDSDDSEREALAEAALIPSGFEVIGTSDGGQALAMIAETDPDLIILDLNLQGLSGHDVLAAMRAQSIKAPVILIANEGQEADALEAFRLGARDYILRPVRDAELIQVVERALGERRLQRERESLAGGLRTADVELERRLRELKTLMSIGKSVTSQRSTEEVFDRVVRAAMQLTRADASGLYLREPSGELLLQGGQNLSVDLMEKVGSEIKDDIASIVASSGETFMASNDGLSRYNPAQKDVKSVIYAPLVVEDETLGMLWVANQKLEFEPHMKDLMTALSDYAAIAVYNARALEAHTTAAEQTDDEEALEPTQEMSKVSDAEVERFQKIELARNVRSPLTQLLGNMNLFRTGEMGKLQSNHQAAVDVMHRQLEQLVELIDSVVPPE